MLQSRNKSPIPQSAYGHQTCYDGWWLKVIKIISIYFCGLISPEPQFWSTFKEINFHGLARWTCYWFLV